MLILFWPKSSAMCRNLRGPLLSIHPLGLNPLFPLIWSGSPSCIPARNLGCGILGRSPKTIFFALT
jgi:hypothetical protein